jgi:hypothetical protein
MRHNRSAISVVCAAGALSLAACDPSPQTTRIVSRTLSPDRNAEAVYALDMSGGATVGPSADVYVVAPGESPRLADRLFSAGRACGTQLRWLDNRTLEISYAARHPDESAPAPELG